MLPAIAGAAPMAGDKEITLGGAGSSDKDFDDTVFSVQGSWGQYLSESSLWGVRQTVNARDTEGESVKFYGSTRVFSDYHFGNCKFRTRRSLLQWRNINSCSRAAVMRRTDMMTAYSSTASVLASITDRSMRGASLASRNFFTSCRVFFYQASTSCCRKFLSAMPGSSSSDAIMRIPHWRNTSS
jgi:hypothetical protein